MDIFNDVILAAAGSSFLAISSVLAADPITTTTAAVKQIRTVKLSATKQTIVKTPTPDSASDKGLTINNVSINASTNFTDVATSLPPPLPASGSQVTFTPSTATTEWADSRIPTDSTSPVLILFCTVLLLVAAALVAKVVAHGKNSRRRFGLDSFRLSANNRSSNQGARLSLGGGPALGIPTSAAGINLGGTSAMYTAMTSDGSASLDAPPVAATTLRDPRLDWERQFFDDDDEEHLATSMEVEPHNTSRLQFNMNQ